MQTYTLLAIPFYIAMVLIPVELVGFPHFTTVFSSPDGIFLLLGTFLYAGFFLWNRHIPVPKSSSFRFLFAFVLYHLVAGVILFPELAAYSFGGRLALSKYILYMIFLFIMLGMELYIYYVLTRRPHALRTLSHVLFITLAAELIYSFVQFLKMVGIPFAVDFMQWAGLIFGRGEESMLAYWLKLYGTTGEPSALANYLLFMIPWIVMEYILVRSSKVKRYIVMLVILLALFVYFFTFSRAAYFGGLISLAIGLLFFWRELFTAMRESFRKIVLGLFCLILVFSFLPSYISNSWDSQMSVEDMTDMVFSSFLDPDARSNSTSNITRTGGMVAAVNVFQEHPIIGSGFGTLPLRQIYYYPEWAKASEEVVDGMDVVPAETKAPREMPGSVLAKVLAEGGLIGMALWCFMFGSIICSCLRLARMTQKIESVLLRCVAWMCVIALVSGINANYIFLFSYILIFPVCWSVEYRVRRGYPILGGES